MAGSRKSLTDICFILFSAIGVTLLGVLIWGGNQQPPEEIPFAGIDPAKRPPEDRLETWSPTDHVGTNQEEMLKALKAAHTFENIDQLNALCDGVRRELGVSDNGDFLPAEQFEGRDVVRRRKAELLDRMVEYRLAHGTATEAQKDKLRKITTLRHLYIEEVYSDSEFDEIEKHQIAEATAGVDDFYFRYLNLLKNHAGEVSFWEQAMALSDACLEKNACALVQFDVEHLCLTIFNAVYKENPRLVEPEDYLKILGRLKDSSARLLQDQSDVAWTPQECWGFFVSRLASMSQHEQGYVLMPLATVEITDAYMKHMLVGYTLQIPASRFRQYLFGAVPNQELGATRMRECSELASLHFQSAWLLQPEDANAPVHQMGNLLYGDSGCFSPKIWLAIVTFTDYDSGSAYWDYAKTLGYEGSLDFAEECITNGAAGSDVPVEGICAIECYATTCPMDGIYEDPRVADIAAKCARNLIAWMETGKGKSEPEFMNRHTRHFAGSILVMNERFTEAAELAMAVPDSNPDNWQQPRYAIPQFGTYLFNCFGSELGLELAEIETLLHSDRTKLNETHLETLDKLIQTTDPNSSQYLEARRAQVLLMIALNDGQPCVLPHTPGYIWEANHSRIEAVDETSFQMIPSGTSEGEITLGLRLPVQYSLSMDLEFSQADSDSKIAFRHRVAYPEELRRRASSRRSVFFKLPATNGTSHFEADVDGSNIICRLNGVELARNEAAVSASVSSREASLGMPIWLNSYVPVKVSNVTIHPAR